MIALTEALLIILIFITVSLQLIDVRIFGDKIIFVEISFTIFSLQLLNLSENRKKRKLKLTKKLKRFKFLAMCTHELLHKSRVTVRSYRPFDGSFLENHIKVPGYAILSPMLPIYLKMHALEYREEDGAQSKIDILFTFTLLSLFISFMKASYYVVKLKIKRGIKSVR